MRLVQCKTEELFGYAEFSHEGILDRLDRYLVGRYYPTLAQMLVLQK